MSEGCSFGHLAMIHTGKLLPLEVMRSAAGHYIGTRNTEGPVSRESTEYFCNAAAARHALESGSWTQRLDP